MFVYRSFSHKLAQIPSLVDAQKILFTTVLPKNFIVEHPVLSEIHTYRDKSATLNELLSLQPQRILMRKEDIKDHIIHYNTPSPSHPGSVYFVGEHAKQMIHSFTNHEQINPNVIFDEDLAKKFNFLTPFYAGKDYTMTGMNLSDEEKRAVFELADHSMENISLVVLTSSPNDVYVGAQILQDILLSRPRHIIRRAFTLNISVTDIINQKIHWISQSQNPILFKTKTTSLHEIGLQPREGNNVLQEYISTLKECEETYGPDSPVVLSLLSRLLMIPILDISSFVGSHHLANLPKIEEGLSDFTILDRALVSKNSGRVFTPSLFTSTISRLLRRTLGVESCLKKIIVEPAQENL